MSSTQRTITIPLFGDRPPHFGSSSKILVVVAENRTVLDQAVFDVEETSPLHQARRLVSLGLEEILCGGIQRRLIELKGVADQSRGDGCDQSEQMQWDTERGGNPAGDSQARISLAGQGENGEGGHPNDEGMTYLGGHIADNRMIVSGQSGD